MEFKRGIDVSKWQGEIDWEKVKGAGVEFAMLRAGYGQGNADSMFARNAAGCEAAGLPYGVYWFSYAWSEESARAEAGSCLQLIRGRKIEYPVASTLKAIAWSMPKSGAWPSLKSSSPPWRGPSARPSRARGATP